MSIFIITGTSGSGKTTLRDLLKSTLSKEKYVVYDMDEEGVPEGADKIWRKKRTDELLKRATENNKNSLSTIICGVTVPSEVKESEEFQNDGAVYFGIIKAPDEVISRRLKERGWGEQLIKDNLNWAHHLEKEVIAEPDHIVVENTDSVDAKEGLEKTIRWISQ